MINLFNELNEEIKKFGKISVICHKRPDGDAIASLVSFFCYLESLGKQVSMYCIDPVPSYLRFLTRVEDIKSSPDSFLEESDAIVLVDCGDIFMPGIDEKYFEKKNIFVIDHHYSNSGYGKINMIDHSASATSEVLYNFFKGVNFNIDKNIATHLFCGIYTDTDAFTNLSTTSRSMKAASDLLALGADFKEISASTMRNKSLSSLKLWSKALERLKIDKKKGVAITVIRQSDFKEFGATNDDAEGVANLLNHLSDVKMSMVLRELEGDFVKGSLRTTKESVDVSQIAKLMGGGGHKKAAGFTVKGKIKEIENGWEVVNG